MSRRVEERDRRRAHVAEVAAQLLRERGLDVTMDDVADAADVGRRTLFRYYATRDELIADAVSVVYNQLAVGADEPTPEQFDSFRDYVLELFRRAHSDSEDGGLVLWHLAVDPPDSPAAAAAVEARRVARASYLRRMTDAVWRGAGGSGTAPAAVRDTLALLESLHTFHGLRIDFGWSVERTASLCADILLAVLAEAGAPTPGS